jgi:hypothetical protein
MKLCRNKLHQFDNTKHRQCPRCHKVSMTRSRIAWRERNPGANSQHSKAHKYFLKKYWPNLSPAQRLEAYNKMFNDQKGCCASCGIHQSELSSALCIDHCHESGQIRSLLCEPCNVCEGWMRNPEHAESLARYIRRLQ